MCTFGIDHTSNGYYSADMTMRAILFPRRGHDEPTEAYCRRFEAAISMDELAKCNTTTHTKLNKTYTGGGNEDGTKSFQEM